MFKKILIILLALAVHLSAAQNNNVKIDSYEIVSDFCGDIDSAGITVLMNITNPSHISSLRLLMNSNCRVNSIICLNTTEKIDYEFTGKDSLILKLQSDQSNSDSLVLKFDYSYPVSIRQDSVTMLDRGHRWYPMIADQISYFKFNCSVPAGYDVIFPGVINWRKDYETKTVSEFQTTFPVFKGSLVIFKLKMYKEFRCDLTGTIISFYYFPNDSLDIKKIISETGRMMNFCDTLIGKLGSNRLTLVEIPAMDGVSIASGLLMIGSSDLKYINKGYYDGLLLAVAEQWFGAGVFSKFGTNGFWLTSLSLPHYIRMMFLKNAYGQEKFNEALFNPLDKYMEFAGSDKDIPIYDIIMPDSPEKSKILYIKGPYIFYKLHMAMGDGNWNEFIKELYRNYFGKVMMLNDFISTLRKYDNEDRAVNLFNTMIFQTGLPE